MLTTTKESAILQTFIQMIYHCSSYNHNNNIENTHNNATTIMTTLILYSITWEFLSSQSLRSQLFHLSSPSHYCYYHHTIVTNINNSINIIILIITPTIMNINTTINIMIMMMVIIINMIIDIITIITIIIIVIIIVIIIIVIITIIIIIVIIIIIISIVSNTI